MTQNYTIFNNGVTLSIIHNPGLTGKLLIERDHDLMMADNYLEKSVELVVNDFENHAFTNTVVETSNIRWLFDEVKKQYDNFVHAAGGLVVDQQQRILMIYRNGKWDLPKGKVEEGEGLEAAAIREVMEETGLGSLAISGNLLKTYHTYTMHEQSYLKETHWYVMQTHGGELVPQQEEGIEEVRWVTSEEWPELLNLSYENIRLVFYAYLERPS